MPVAAEAAVAEAGRGLAAIDIGTAGSTAATTMAAAAAAIETAVSSTAEGAAGAGCNVDVTGAVDDLTPSGLQGSDTEEGHLSGLSDLESLMDDQVCGFGGTPWGLVAVWGWGRVSSFFLPNKTPSAAGGTSRAHDGWTFY